MEIAIIAEGITDVITIKNILKGKLGIDSSDIRVLRPEYSFDNTDIKDSNIDKFSNWEIVKEECCSRDKIKTFLDSPLLDERRVIISIDTDQIEHENFDLKRPEKNEETKKNLEEYSETLVNLVKEKMKEWLENEFIENIRFAIAVEEIEAWVLTLYQNHLQNTKDTSSYENPKIKLELLEKKLNNLSLDFSKKKKPNEKKRFKKSTKDSSKKKKPNEKKRFEKLTKGFSKKKELKECIKHNKSLEIFYNSI